MYVCISDGILNQNKIKYGYIRRNKIIILERQLYLQTSVFDIFALDMQLVEYINN